jgi:L-2,4-diaminobutyric acid acetyltransferase
MKIDIKYRKTLKKDSKGIFNLVKESEVLDVNSEYLYLLQSTHFSDYCCVALVDEKIVGFVSGYLHPKHRDTYFVWQVAVDSSMRGQGVASKMIVSILNRENLKDIKYIHTTISPSNIASQRVFEKLAKELNTNVEKETMFAIDDFCNGHEDEILYKIGPINIKGIK